MEISPQTEKPKIERKKTQKSPVTGLRRSTRLNPAKELHSKSIKHIDVKTKENLEAGEDLGIPPRASPRVSSLTFTLPPQIPGRRTPKIGLVQQEIYDYIESLDKRDTTKISIPNQEEE